MKKSLKSQVTMLIIIGLLLFIVVSLVLYLSKYAVKKQSISAVKKSQTGGDTQLIVSFVNRCVEKLSEDAVELLGKQGGYIYVSQGGTLADYSENDKGIFFIENSGGGKDYDVSYNIIQPKFDVGIYFANPKDYPWQNFPNLAGSPVYAGIFGLNGMPPLEKAQGLQSVQRQIETYIDSNIPACLDFSPFEEQGFEIGMLPAKSSVVIGSKDVTINAKIPLTIRNIKTEKTTELDEFSTGLDLRLKDIYLFARSMINSDITNIKFNINDLSNEGDSFEIDMEKDVSGKDDIITIKDRKSLIYGKPLEYVFGRKNRAPALHYYNTPLSFPDDSDITQSDLLQGSGLNAEDPDEDELSFDITPSLPYNLKDHTDFTIKVKDGLLEDYQTISVNVE